MNMEYKKLYRSRDNRMVGGVCAGLGDYVGIDPTVVRLAFALVTIFGFPATIPIYIILLLVVPEEPIATVTTTHTTATAPAEPATGAAVYDAPQSDVIHGEIVD